MSSKQNFDVFWSKAKEYLEEDIGTAVDDRRQSGVVHVAKAISVRDFRQQVRQRCPPDTCSKGYFCERLSSASATEVPS